MPTVLTTSKTTNQTLVPFLAAFHNASPFQTNDQTMTSPKNGHHQSDIKDQDCPQPPIMFPAQPPIMLYIKRWLLAGRGVFSDDKPTG